MTAMTRLACRGLVARVSAAAGGSDKLGVIALLGGSLALAAADQTIAGAVAPDLKTQLGISNTLIGLLVTAASVMAAVTTVPFGILADRTHRVRLLALCALEWSASVAVAGFADSYGVILGAQIALGAGVGAAGPAVASLVGDLFPPGARGRALGMILAAEFAGAASGLLLAGEIAGLWSWRGSFWTLALIGPVLAATVLIRLAEPQRGAQSASADHPDPAHSEDLASGVRAAGVEPRKHLVLDRDPARQPLRWAVRYVLSVPTNVVLIIASALAYFYVAGVQTFAIVYLRGKFDLSQEVATALLVVIGIGVVVGILATGQLSDRLISRGHAAARLSVGGGCFFLAVAAFVPGFATGGLLIALPLLFLGAAALGGVNPPLDAARLDVVPSGLWGRAESIRNVCQNLIKAGAPLLFGYLSVVLAGDGPTAGAADSATTSDNGTVVAGFGTESADAVGLNRAFLVLLALFVIAGLVLIVARRAYLRDVATMLESEHR